MRYEYWISDLDSDEDTEEIEKEVNDRSEEGWELIHVVYLEDFEKISHYFRRPLEEKTVKNKEENVENLLPAHDNLSVWKKK